MKFVYKLFVIIIISAGLSSCQKVIEVKLNSADQRYVIEGEINDGPGPYKVTISRTKDFSADNSFDRISGAQVKITDATAGTTELLQENSTGTYQTSTTTGIPGHTYQLIVNVNSQTFSANSVMPQQAVGLDTLYASQSEFNDKDIFMTPVFTDPVGKGNYYLVRQWVNDQLIKGTAVISDDATDGKVQNFKFYYNTDDNAGNPKINKGDKITAELQCVNKQVFDYYRTLRDVTGASNSATPTNPLTNLTGGALGIFNTCTSRKRSTTATY